MTESNSKTTGSKGQDSLICADAPKSQYILSDEVDNFDEIEAGSDEEAIAWAKDRVANAPDGSEDDTVYCEYALHKLDADGDKEEEPVWADSYTYNPTGQTCTVKKRHNWRYLDGGEFRAVHQCVHCFLVRTKSREDRRNQGLEDYISYRSENAMLYEERTDAEIEAQNAREAEDEERWAAEDAAEYEAAIQNAKDVARYHIREGMAALEVPV